MNPAEIETVARAMRASLGLEGDPPQCTLDLAAVAITALRAPHTELVERLQHRASKLRKQIASCQLVVDLLAPEMEKFMARTEPHDIYTVRMSADHQSSIRAQIKEADDLDAAIAALQHREKDEPA